MGNAKAQQLAVRLKDDGVWKTANLKMQGIPYSVASTVANTGYGVKGRPVDETVLLDRVSDAWETMLANHDRPLDEPMFRHYAYVLAVPKAKYIEYRVKDPEEKALKIFREVWPVDHALAAMCANHVLVHAGIGLFGIYPRQLKELETNMSSGGSRVEQYLRDNAVELAPSGLTRERMKALGRGSQQ